VSATTTPRHRTAARWCACTTRNGRNYGDDGCAWCNDCGRRVAEKRGVVCCACGQRLRVGSNLCWTCGDDDREDRAAITTFSGVERAS